MLAHLKLLSLRTDSPTPGVTCTAHFISSSLAAIDWTKHGHLMQSLFWANWILSLEIFETEHRNSSLFRALGLEPSVWTTRKSRRN